MRIFSISLGALIVVGILILMARIWGMGLIFSPYENAFFNGPSPLIIVKANELSEASKLLKEDPNLALWMDVRFSRDKVPFVLDPGQDHRFLDNRKMLQEKSPTTPILTGGHLSEYNWKEIQEFYTTAPTVRDYYVQFPTSKFVLNLIDNVSDAHTSLVEALEDVRPNGRTFVQSEALILMTAVKELKPEWVYGTSVPDLMRLMIFDSMFILPSIQFKGDVFISPFEIQKRPAFNENIISEMRRRQRRVILGPIQNITQLELARKYKAEGYITENLTELRRLLGQGPAQ